MAIYLTNNNKHLNNAGQFPALNLNNKISSMAKVKSKKCPCLLGMTIAILLFAPPVFADGDADDWSSIYDSYNNAQYGKPVSEKEVEDAIKTIKKYNKTDKEKKKTLKDGKSTGENAELDHDPKEIAKPPEIPDSPGHLFVLPTDVYLGEEVIEKGFYLAEGIEKNNNHFIRLTRGEGNIIAEIEANATDIDRIQTISGGKTSISSEIMENGLLKIMLIDTKRILEAYLWTQ